MSKAKLDGETRVQKYIVSLDLRPERFSETEMSRSKTPDFRVYAGDELGFYCEVKTAQKDEWLDQQIASVDSGGLAAGLRDDPTYNRISKYVAQAVQQFDAVNSSLELPNALAIVNGDEEAGFTDLIQVLTGNSYCEGGEVIAMFRQFSEGWIREDKSRVHLYLWFDAWEASEPRLFFPAAHPAHDTAMCKYFRVNAAERKPLPGSPQS